MKLPARIIRRRKSQPGDGSFFKKENSQEQSFFAEHTNGTFFQPAANAIQRKCAGCQEEDKVQRMPAKEEDEKKLQRKPGQKEEEEKKISRLADKKEEDKLHRKEGGGNNAVSQPGISSYVNTLPSKGSPLPKDVQHFFSARIGYAFKDVKIHTGSEAEASAKQINAKAYAIGNHIVFNEGQYNPSTHEGKKLLAHELAHTLQQRRAGISRKEGEAEETTEECTAGSVDLEALTTATFNKNAGTAANEKTKKSKGCTNCEDECVNITGTLLVPYKATTSVNLPAVPANLSPCQQERVTAAINGPLNKHEKQHVKEFEKFTGTASLAINYNGCESDYVSYQENLAEQEFERRKSSAEAKSAALDPFSVPVDLCCVDKPKKK